jgi:hypothetical protein
MGKRGRRSANLLSINVEAKPPPLASPSCLNDEERDLFKELVAACDTRNLAKSDLPLLVAYVQASLISQSAARAAARDPTRIVAWEKACRMQVMLATKLRLAPQSRSDPKTVGRRQPPPGLRPWD